MLPGVFFYKDKNRVRLFSKEIEKPVASDDTTQVLSSC